MASYSLHHDLTTIPDVEALCGVGDATAQEVEATVFVFVLVHANDACGGEVLGATAIVDGAVGLDGIAATVGDGERAVELIDVA